MCKNKYERFISETHKECLGCKKVFERSYYKHDSRGKILARCPECHKVYQTERCRKYSNTDKRKEYNKQYTGIRKKRLENQGILAGKVKNHITVCKCEQCEKLFTRKGTVVKRFCSTECGREFRRLESIGKKKDRMDREYKCKSCGRLFINKAPGKCKRCAEASRKMIKKAQEKKRRAALRTVAIQPVIDIKVFARDKWICCQCGCKVQKVNIYSDNAAELDHIVPVSLGGPHSYSNVQTLCRRCNQQKSNNYNGQLILSI